MPINYEAAKTLIKGLVQKMKSFRGNWNQNDPTADDYIKNRPFYTEQVEIVILPETTIDGEGDVNIKSPLVVGQEYKITWNGVVYRSIARDYDGYRMIGNNAIYEYDNGIENNTGEPFAAEEYGDDLILFFHMDDTVTEPPVVSITTIGESVHKIDKKFIDIPANLATTDEVGNMMDALYDNVMADVNGTVNNKMNATNPVGTGSFSMNRKADTTIGDYSHAEGSGTTASGRTSHAEGLGTTASGGISHAEGLETTASGDYSHAEGWLTTASGGISHAEGSGTTASGGYSHAEGWGTTASGDYSHAEGSGTTASGEASHAEGSGTTASGEASHAEGKNTIAAGKNQHVQGKYNVEDSNDKYAHIVGNGTSSNRSNAHTLDWNGNAWFKGSVYVGGTGQNDATALQVASVATMTTSEYEALETAGTTNANVLYMLTDGEDETIPVATTSVLGGVKSGGDIIVNSDGSVNLNSGVVGATELANTAVTEAKIAAGAVSRAKLAEDALYSPTKYLDDTGVYSISAYDLGKTLQNPWNKNMAISLSSTILNTIPVGAEFAVVRWGTVSTVEVTFEVDDNLVLYLQGDAATHKKVKIAEPFGMIAIKRMSSTSNGGFIVTGNVEVVE